VSPCRYTWCHCKGNKLTKWQCHCVLINCLVLNSATATYCFVKTSVQRIKTLIQTFMYKCSNIYLNSDTNFHISWACSKLVNCLFIKVELLKCTTYVFTLFTWSFT
jgi:hypothetical protein